MVKTIQPAQTSIASQYLARLMRPRKLKRYQFQSMRVLRSGYSPVREIGRVGKSAGSIGASRPVILRREQSEPRRMNGPAARAGPSPFETAAAQPPQRL